MKQIFLTLIAIFSFVATFAQEDIVGVNGAWMKKHYSKTEYMIPMQDGTKLYTAVYTPKNKKIKSPILLCRTQNGYESYGKKSMTLWSTNIYKRYLLNEYILAFQDVRGRGKSEGNFTEAQPSSDAYSTIDWLLRKVRRHNEYVGVWGSANDGVYAMQAATCGHPAIRAVSPQGLNQEINTDSPITAATLFVGGLFDSESKTYVWRAYRSMTRNNGNTDCRIVVGPWVGNAWRENGCGAILGEEDFSDDASSEFFGHEIEFPFFDHYLRGNEDSGASSSGVFIYFTGENCWRELSDLNDATTAGLEFYLAEDNCLVAHKTQEIGLSTSYTVNPDNPTPCYSDTTQPIKPEYIVSGQEFLENRDDVLTFSTDILTDDVTVIGEVEVTLYATTPAEGADFVVKIIDESANQEHEMMLRAEMFRNSSNKYEECGAGIRKYKFTLSDVAHTFFAGHRIKLQIQSAWHPLYEVTQKTPFEVRIHHDKEHPSAVRLNMMK